MSDSLENFVDYMVVQFDERLKKIENAVSIITEILGDIKNAENIRRGIQEIQRTS